MPTFMKKTDTFPGVKVSIIKKAVTAEKRAIIDLVNAYTELCPTQEDKDSVRALVHQMRKEHNSDRAICTALAARLFDGLKYNNWPSELAKTGLSVIIPGELQ